MHRHKLQIDLFLWLLCATASLVLVAPNSAMAQGSGHHPASGDAAGALVRPGSWQVTPQGTAGASLNYQLCFKSGGLDDLKLLLPNLVPPAGCASPTLRQGDGRLSWDVDCPAQSLRAEARYQLAADAIDGKFTITQGTPAATSSQTIVARRVGACIP